MCISRKQNEEHIQKFREYQSGACDKAAYEMLAKIEMWKKEADAKDAKEKESVAAPIPSTVPQGETFRTVRVEQNV